MRSVTPFFSILVSSSATSSSKVKPYWKPEQPPPVTNTRSFSSGLPSSSISVLTLAAAASVKTSGAGISVTSVIAFIATPGWLHCSTIQLSRPRALRSNQSVLLAGRALQLRDRCRLRLGVNQLALHDRADVHLQPLVLHITVDPRL